MKTIVHKVGNKILGEALHLSKEELQLEETSMELLKNYFLSPFKTEETYHFYSDTYLKNNKIFAEVSEIFTDNYYLEASSQEIARHLYDVAENPRIQGGELFVVLFKAENDNEVDKIGIFKTEKRESFLKIFGDDESFDFETDQGISLAKIDKAALIFNKGKESGYVLQVVDNNKNGDIYYWFEDFLKVKQRTDAFFHTQESLHIFKDYIKKQLPSEFEITKTDQADFLNKSINFFREKEEFKLEEFTQEVLQDKAVIESFNTFKTDYEQEMQINVAEEFPINDSAVKKSQKHFKSIIKLDKNFHIYIHGDKSKIVQEQDEKGKFYKVYFDKEV